MNMKRKEKKKWGEAEPVGVVRRQTGEQQLDWRYDVCMEGIRVGRVSRCQRCNQGTEWTT